ncbi:MAG TPA: DUF2079 domain-containing protein [Chloroflexota bacterium]|nr:DUF2079 domain-containing protein [Chloroflexota bacterium]
MVHLLSRRHSAHGTRLYITVRKGLTYGRRQVPVFALALLIALYAITAGGLALRRHWNLESQALDMGYADQVTWNAAAGRGLRFTVFRGNVGAEHGQPLSYGPGADRDSLFAYHVELLFFPIAALYWLRAGPETLIVLLTVVLALGAVPVYLIARHQLRHRGAALAFGVMYLLFPSVQGANLADFHVVSMSATLLLGAAYFLLTRRPWWFALLAGLATAAKEEVGLLVGMLGLYAWLVQGQRRLGSLVAGASFAWVALCFLVLIPRANGGAGSLFVSRYGDAMDVLRSFPAELLAGRLALPVPDYAVRYVTHLLASTGFLALLSPLHLLLAAPGLAVNGLSGSIWQHGGGAHYSSEVVPGLLLAAIAGTRRLSDLAWRYMKIPPGRAAAATAVAGLTLAMVQSHHQGILPPATRSLSSAVPDALSPHGLSTHAARARPILDLIPPQAAVSAQSNLFPHLSHREKIYVFPAVDDAEYVVTDVAGTSDPLYPDHLFTAVEAMLADPRFQLLAGDDGLLLFRRLPVARSGGAPLRPPASFYSFVFPSPHERFTPLEGRFGEAFEIVGYHPQPLLEVNFATRRARVAVYVRARQVVDRAYRFTPYVVGPDAVARLHDDGTAVQRWYPTQRWKPGELIRLTYPPITYARGDRLGLGVQVEDATRGVLRLPAAAPGATILDQGRILVLGSLP